MNPTIRMSLLLSVLVFGMTLSCQSPNDPDPPVDPGPGVLALELYASPRLTFMQVKLSANPADLPLDSLVLLRNDLSADTLRLTKPDTVLSLTGLTPSTTYIWKVTGKKNTRPYASNPLPTRTMDTTSHHFTWQVDTIGAPGSILWDVAIVNDTCVWVVGDILKYPYDSSDRYNAAMWNGKTWTKVRINTPSQTTNILSPKIIQSILFIDGQLWITTEEGGYAILENQGISWKPFRFPGGSRSGRITKGWASSRSNIYWVGTNGSITHYDGKNFRLVESGTDRNLTDLTKDGLDRLWICGWQHDKPDGVVLVQSESGFMEVQNNSPIFLSAFTGIRSLNKSEILLSGDGQILRIRDNNISSSIQEELNGQPIQLRAFTYSFSGPEENNIITAGVRGAIAHYNGFSWNTYPQFYGQFREFKSVNSNGTLAISCGYDYLPEKVGIILIGRQQRSY